MYKPELPDWKQSDGTPIDCNEKLNMLAENHQEVHQLMQDVFDDAILMGVDEQFMRKVLHLLIDSLKSPKK